MTPLQIITALANTNRFAVTADNVPVSALLPALIIEKFSLLVLPLIKKGDYRSVTQRLFSQRIDDEIRDWLRTHLPSELINCVDADHPPKNMPVEIFEEILINIARGKKLRDHCRRKLKVKIIWSWITAVLLVYSVDLLVAYHITKFILEGDYPSAVSSMVVYYAMIIVGGIACTYDLHWKRRVMPIIDKS